MTERFRVWKWTSNWKVGKKGRREGGREERRGGAHTNVHRACLQLQSVTHRQAATVVRRFLLLRGKIPRIINSEAPPPYLAHSVSPSQSLTGNPSACIAGESEKEKNRRGKGERKDTPATEILLSGKSWKIHRGWWLIAERGASWRSQTYRLGADDWVFEGDW